jgi:hypothetical protein
VDRDKFAAQQTTIAANELSARWMDLARWDEEPEHCEYLYYKRHGPNRLLRAFYKDRRDGRIRVFGIKLELGLKLIEVTDY